jgi:hypothetical protein
VVIHIVVVAAADFALHDAHDDLAAASDPKLRPAIREGFVDVMNDIRRRLAAGSPRGGSGLILRSVRAIVH